MSDITVYVTSPLTSSERKISPQWSLEYFKTRLHPITGIEPRFQQLYLYPITHSNERVELKADSGQDESMTLLSSFKVGEFQRIHVKDTNPDSSLTELDTDLQQNDDYRFELSKESYEKRTDSVMNWKKQNKLGRYDPNFEQKRLEQEAKIATKIQNLQVGQRCRTVNDAIGRLGTIRFIGKVPEIDDSTWCGVEFDEPLGKNDGSIKGVRYFKCLPNYGSFLSPLVVEVGDFPVLDILEESEDEL